MNTATRLAYAAALSMVLSTGPAAAHPVSPAAYIGASDTAATGAVAGTVLLPAPDGRLVTVPGAPITLTCTQDPPRTEISDGQGRFRFGDATAGACVVSAELDGATGSTSIEVRAGEITEVALTLELEARH